MSEIPSMWRVELLHPLAVHLPIALLAVGTLLWLAGRVVAREGPLGFLLPAGRLLLVLGTAGAWLAIYTGTLAEAEVGRTLCDPTVKDEHEELAFLVGYLFTAGVVVDLAARFLAAPRRIRSLAAVLVAAALIGGSVLLGYVGHLGGKLVYQQGAAVHHPAEDCRAFE